jgi:hypothetical protein
MISICAWCEPRGKLTVLSGHTDEQAAAALEAGEATHGICDECLVELRADLAKLQKPKRKQQWQPINLPESTKAWVDAELTEWTKRTGKQHAAWEALEVLRTLAGDWRIHELAEYFKDKEAE